MFRSAVRLLALGIVLAVASPAITTFLNDYTNGIYATAAGGPFEGVVKLLITVPSEATYICSGSVIMSGFSILTAAHCVANNFGVLEPGTTATAYFDLGGSLTTTQIFVNPLWDISTLAGDIALLRFNTPAPGSAQRYDIWRPADGSELGLLGTIAGYGRVGNGATGSIPGTAGTTKLQGDNYVSALSSSFLWFDFDDGLVAHDVFGGPNAGDREINPAPGDSGGPTFINGKIAGVTSWGDCNDKDIDYNPVTGACTVNSSFGEYFGNTRVSTYSDWIQLMDLPEPASYATVGAGLLLAAFLWRSHSGRRSR